jgi:hypothetical protein
MPDAERSQVGPAPGTVGADGPLGDIEAIKQLKYAYFRLLDLKRFDELGELLTEGATASYENSGSDLRSRRAIVAFLDDALSDHGIISLHHGHHPEIVLTSPTTATGVWYLQDRVIVPAYDVEIAGAAFYDDVYTKVGDRWFISHTGYQRVFEERRTHTTHAVTSLRHRFAPTETGES